MGKMNMTKFLDGIKGPKVSELGGKGYSLAVLINSRFDVPKGFVIVSDAFFEYLKRNNLMNKIEKLTSDIDENNFQEKTKEIKNLILNGKMPEEISSEIRENLNKLNVQYISTRSSAVSEDSLKASFAGLHDTFLNIKAELNLVLENVKKCWASLFNERAVIYRIKKKIPHLEGIAIIVQEMIPVEISGITFTVHPTDEKSLLVEASYGLGDMIASGKVEPDDYTIDREALEIIEKKTGKKDKMSIVEGEKIKVIETKKELAEKQVLPDDKIKELAEICLKVEKIFNYPQDIEWGVSNNKLWLLQSRAITGAIR
ncbi:MAG: PEP/pyruvate-binding domain-containing protein [Patescibacteria group bacterium]|nr:PEP/pyruvate-binding domain-containing protein [Patescibacteria group bacterium]